MIEQKEEIGIIEVLDILLIKTYQFVAKSIKILTVFFILGFLFAFLFWHYKGNTYKTNIMAASNTGHYYEVSEIINSLTPISEKPQLLQQILKLSPEDAKNMREISADTIINHNILIKIKYKEKIDYKNVEQKIKNYVEQNQFMIREVDLHKKNYFDLSVQLAQEIQELDSLQNLILKNLDKEVKLNNQVLIKNDKLEFYHNDILTRKKQLIDLENALTRLNAIDIIKPITEAHVSYFSLPQIFIGFITIFLFLGFILSVLFNVKQKLSNLKK
jgi:hypothetical protein